MKSISNMESQETTSDAPMPSRSEILAAQPDSPFGHENCKPGDGVDDKSVNLLLDSRKAVLNIIKVVSLMKHEFYPEHG